MVGRIGGECSYRCTLALQSETQRGDAQSRAHRRSADLAAAHRDGIVRKLLVLFEEYEMSIRSKILGSCDAVLIAIVGALQLGLILAFTGTASHVDESVGIETDQAYVEVVVVEASKISRG